jgi:hypothetical protein
MSGQTHLVIGDSHATPGIDNRRFDWLGQIIVDLKPDVIINIGDMADMESLCSYDRGTKGYEGRRYKKDIDVVLDAQERMFAPLRKLQKRQAKTKHKQYRPDLVLTLGNHENRINRATNSDAMLDGTISVDDLQYEEFGWEVSPFLRSIERDGVSYSHYFVSGVMDRAIGGEHPATMILNKEHKSSTCGHSHLADWAIRRQGNTHIMGAVTGCFFEHGMDYVSDNVNHMYWKGLLIKRNVNNGIYDPEFYSMHSIKKDYL